ncbi:low temperature requirement protein A [Streptomyces sp. NPDC001970]
MNAPVFGRRLWSGESANGRVAPTEFFFDLVFVFVVTQVTHVVETHPGWEGLLKGLLSRVASTYGTAGDRSPAEPATISG